MKSITRSSARFERHLYLSASLFFLALVFWTFARTFYLKPFFGTPPLSALLHIHGAVMTGWVVLLVVQPSLIVAHRVQWHRRLGVTTRFGTTDCIRRLWGGASLFVAAFHIALYFTQTPAWIAFGESLLS